MDSPKRSLAEDHSIVELLGDLVRDLTGLVRAEGQLARAEIAEAGRSLASGAERIATGAVLLLVALVMQLAHWVGPAWAPLILGTALALIAGGAIASGRTDIGAASLVPERTSEQTSRDARLAREQI